MTEDGSGVTLTDNGWKAVEGNFEVTEDTVLSFTFSADVIGEIHGIGFANGDSLQPGTFFKLAGTQAWGLESGEWQYVPGSGAVEMQHRSRETLHGHLRPAGSRHGRRRGGRRRQHLRRYRHRRGGAEPVNTPPEAVDDSFTTGHGAPLVLDAADLLANDGDADGDALSVTGVRRSRADR